MKGATAQPTNRKTLESVCIGDWRERRKNHTTQKEIQK